MSFTISRARRKAVPALISIASVSGGGKTFSSLLLASGLAGPGGEVGFLDTENGRGSMYADSPEIRAVLPNSYMIAEMTEPFTPGKYAEAVDAFVEKGVKVLVIDSMTHEWEGHGGCCDIAESNKVRGMPNWARAKLEHKRLMNHLLACPMHIVFCLRARDKIKIVKDARGRDEFVNIGIQPITEKNFIFEMTLSMTLDEHSHLPTLSKCPPQLRGIFADGALVNPGMGEKIRAWAASGAAGVTPGSIDAEALLATATAYAAQGTSAYSDFFLALTPPQKKALLASHEQLKEQARQADVVLQAENEGTQEATT